jgi:hypothetical protein
MMPVMPKMRPLNKNKATAATPNKRPPANEGQGVK